MDNALDALRYVNNPYALIGLTVVVVIGFVVRQLSAKQLDLSTRRIISLGLLVLGGIVIIGSFSLLTLKHRRPDPEKQKTVGIQGDGNVVGNGNAVNNGQGNTIMLSPSLERPTSPARKRE